MQNLAVSIDDARRLIAAWHRAYPRVQELIEGCTNYTYYTHYTYYTYYTDYTYCVQELIEELY